MGRLEKTPAFQRWEKRQNPQVPKERQNRHIYRGRRCIPVWANEGLTASRTCSTCPFIILIPWCVFRIERGTLQWRPASRSRLELGRNCRTAEIAGMGIKCTIVAFGLCVLVGTLLYVRKLVIQSVYRAEAIQLPLLVDRWIEAGRPEGDVLKEFMRGRRDDIVVTNRILKIGGSNYLTRFSLTNPNINAGVSAFLITTNGILIMIDKNGRAQVAPSLGL
jgi:hypothetical protein